MKTLLFLSSVLLFISCTPHDVRMQQNALKKRNMFQKLIITETSSTSKNTNLQISVNNTEKILENKYRALFKVKPLMPKDALKGKINGWVEYKFDVNAKGEPFNIKLISSRGANLFDQPARYALSKWLYKPFVDKGKIYNVKGVVEKFYFFGAYRKS